MEPDFSFEERARAMGYARIAGVDEVGRGPLAGPVTAAAVVLDPARIPQGLRDSKKLTAKARQRLHDEIAAVAEVSIAHATVEEIDSLNILRASHLAMVRALNGLRIPADYALIDGNMLPRDMPLPAARLLRQALEATAALDGSERPRPLPLHDRLDQNPEAFRTAS